MNLKKLTIIILSLVCVIAASTVIYTIAANEGTATDPLITKSYLDQVFVPQINELINQAAKEAANSQTANLDAIYNDYKARIEKLVNDYNTANGAALNNKEFTEKLDKALSERLLNLKVESSNANSVFNTKTLSQNATLTCTVGTEFFVRSGSVTANVELLNVPKGTTVAAGTKLELNTLYICPSSGIVLTSQDSSSIFIRGNYS